MATKTDKTDKVTIPEGYMMNAKGHLVPIAQINELEVMEDGLAREIALAWTRLSADIAELKASAMADIQALVDISAEKYGAKLGGAKGNVTLYAFDGSIKVQRKMADDITFDIRLQAAKTLIDECLHEWTEGSPGEVRSIIDSAFAVDKEGKISTGRVLGLRRIKSTNEKWLRAMEAISDSVRVVSSKTYIHVFRRGAGSEYLPVRLDVARV